MSATMRCVLVLALALMTGACSGGDPTGVAGPPGPPWPGTAQVVAAGVVSTCALTTAAKVYCWGRNNGNIGMNLTGLDACSPDPFSTPAYVYPCYAVTPVPANGNLTLTTLTHTETEPLCGRATSGVWYCWSEFNVELPPNTDTLMPGLRIYCGTRLCRELPWPMLGPTLASFRWSRGFGCGLTAAGAAYCRGVNNQGQLGIGSNLLGQSDTFVAVVGGHVFTSLATPEQAEHACGLVAGGAAWCWGNNNQGAVGTGLRTNSEATPVAVTGGFTFTALATGAAHTCGLRSNGQAYCWGGNSSGELGNGSFTGNCSGAQCTPVLVGGGHVFTSITAGSGFTCGLKAGGDAYCWGYNRFGPLGDGYTSPLCPGSGSDRCSATPVLVQGGLKFSMIDAGNQHACGITLASEVYCWGYNHDGQLGTGSRNQGVGLATPQKVGGLA